MISKVNIALSRDLRKKYGVASLPVCRGDMVEISGGTRKGEGGKVVVVDHKTGKVIIDGVSISKSDGKQSEFPVNHSRLIITRIDGSRKERMERLKAKTEARNLKFEEPEPIEPEEVEAPAIEDQSGETGEARTAETTETQEENGVPEEQEMKKEEKGEDGENNDQ